MIELTPQQIKDVREANDKIMQVVNESSLDVNMIIAVLTKCLIEYAVHVEDRDDFHMRMAMTYDFVKAQQPQSKEIH